MNESMFNIIVGKIGDKTLLFNSRTCAFVLLSQKEQEILKRGIILDQNDVEMLAELESGGFLLPDGKQQELKAMELSYHSSTHQSSHLGLTILPTLACNCRCPYCFEHKTGESISSEVAQAIIEHVSKVFEKNKRLASLSVSWFGGEPLLEANIVEELSKAFIDITEKNNAGYSANIITNGTLMDEDMAKRMASSKITSCQFTLDGSRKIHDSKRKLVDGKGTFDLIIKNILSACKHIGRIAVRINVDKEVSENFDDLFKQIASLKKIKNIGIYPGHLQSEISKACASVESDCMDVAAFSQVSVNFQKKMIENGFGFHWSISPRYSCCGATSSSSMVIGPNGDLWKCWNQVGLTEERFSNITNIDKCFDDTNFYNWVLHNPFKNLTCKKCIYFPVCLGGCPAKTVKTKSNFLDTEKRNLCTTAKYNLKDMLMLMYEQRIDYIMDQINKQKQASNTSTAIDDPQ